eukprot:7101427-Alexandrium_andersonii.AAC.1
MVDHQKDKSHSRFDAVKHLSLTALSSPAERSVLHMTIEWDSLQCSAATVLSKLVPTIAGAGALEDPGQ